MSDSEILGDDDLMTIGKWGGRPLGEVPDSYWQWFREQEWAGKYPRLLEYANTVD